MKQSAFLLATLVGGLVVAGCGSAAKPTAQYTTSPATTAAGAVTTTGAPLVSRARTVAVPHGFNAGTAAAVGTRDLWVLGDYRCGRSFCSALIRSSDGGRHFRRVAAPPLPSQGGDPTLVFANARDGYAYTWAQSPLYVTHDGGLSWQRALGRSTIAVAVGGHTVYVVSVDCSKAGCRRFQLRRSGVSRTAWHTLALPARIGRLTSLAVRGSRLWLLGNTNTLRHFDRLVWSTNGGRTFTVQSGPCFADLGGRLVPAGDGVVWAICPSGMMAALELSTDGGRVFPLDRSFHDPGGLHQPPLTNGAEIAAGSPRDAILYTGAQGPFLHTTDRGLHWTRVRQTARFGQVFWLAFTTRRVGAAIVETRRSGNRGELWRTTNGGTTWQNVPLH